jgi:predicted lipoprotein with Yx(FWY)xxD motif
MKATTPGTPQAGITARAGAALAITTAMASGLLAAAGVSAGPAAAAGRGPAEIGDKVLVKTATVHKYGKVLVDQKGRVLYYNTDDKRSHWACTGACLIEWPPLNLPKGEALAQLSNGISGLGTVAGIDGTQATWDGKPLYTFSHDSRGTVKGEGIAHVWYVVQVSQAAAGANWT